MLQILQENQSQILDLLKQKSKFEQFLNQISPTKVPKNALQGKFITTRLDAGVLIELCKFEWPTTHDAVVNNERALFDNEININGHHSEEHTRGTVTWGMVGNCCRLNYYFLSLVEKKCV